MAAAKKDPATKVMDVKAPGKSAPAASGRPIIVTNHPVLTNDPMVTSGETPADDVKTDTAPVVHTAKVIKPLSEDTEASVPQDSEADTEPSMPEIENESGNKKIRLAPLKAGADQAANPESDTTSPTPPTDEAEHADQFDDETAEDTTGDVDGEKAAAENAAEEARNAREAELEQLIASGKYALPIKAAKQGSKFFRNLLIVLLVLVLAAAVVDALLDAGIISIGNFKAPTNFFQDSPTTSLR